MITGRLRCVAFAVSLLFALPVHASLIVNGGTITGAAAWTLEVAGSTATEPAARAAGGRGEVAPEPLPAGPGPAASSPG